MKAINILASTILTIVGVGCSTSGNTETEHNHHHHDTPGNQIELSEDQIKTTGIELGSPRLVELNEGVRASGLIEANPDDQADITPLYPGIIKKINVIDGQHVAAGYPLLYIENAEIISLQQQYIEALDNASLARTELERQQALNREGAGIVKNLQGAENVSRIADAKVAALASQLRMVGLTPPTTVSDCNFSTQYPVKSPISGVVTKISCNVGAYVDGSASLLCVVDNSNVFARLRIFEQQSNAVEPGAHVEMMLTNDPNCHFQGTVRTVNRAIDPQTGAMSAAVNIIDPKSVLSSGLMPGMALTAIIGTGSSESYALPTDAFVSGGGKSYVFRLKSVETEDGKKMYHFEKQEVVTHVSDMGMTSFSFADGSKITGDESFAVANVFYLNSATSDHGEHNH